MRTENWTQAQLILLAISEQSPDLTRERLMEWAVRSLYLDYFTAAEALQYLLQHKMLCQLERKEEDIHTLQGKPVQRINLTPAGQHVLRTLRKNLPPQIQNFLRQMTTETKRDDALSAHYRMDANQSYQVTLEQKDGDSPIVLISLSVPNEALARTICHRWQTQADEVYQNLLNDLLHKPNPSNNTDT